MGKENPLQLDFLDLVDNKKEGAYTLGETILEKRCIYCGDNLVQNVIRIKYSPKGKRVRLGIEIFCPHDGLINYREEKIDSANLIIPNKSFSG
jgi:hypothetical protein